MIHLIEYFHLLQRLYHYSRNFRPSSSNSNTESHNYMIWSYSRPELWQQDIFVSSSRRKLTKNIVARIRVANCTFIVFNNNVVRITITKPAHVGCTIINIFSYKTGVHKVLVCKKIASARDDRDFDKKDSVTLKTRGWRRIRTPPPDVWPFDEPIAGKQYYRRGAYNMPYMRVLHRAEWQRPR